VPLLEIIVNQLAGAGVQDIMVNSHHLTSQITDFLEHHSGPHTLLSHSHEPELLGTGGAIKKVEDFWDDEPFLVVNGDILHTVDLAVAYRTHITHDNLATLVLHDYPRFNQVEVDHEGTVVGIRRQKVRETKRETSMLAFTGIHIISPRLLDEIPSSRPVDIINLYLDLAARGMPIRAHQSSNHYWCDIGTPEDYHRIHRDIYENRHCLAGIFSLSAAAAAESRPGEGTTLDGYVAVGNNARIGNNCRITDSIIWDNVSIDDNLTIRHCIVGDEAHIKKSYYNQIII
jgi:NDP-sugar pyrophosphorylase family protein